MNPLDPARGGRPAARTLVPVIAQDVRTNNVLMMAWADAEALRRTRRTGYMHYWSRSRGKYWKKGEESGHVQKLVSLHYDCDRDTILARVEQTGPACHKGAPTCFTRAPWRARGAIDDLWRVFGERTRRPRPGSYTNALLSNPDRLRQKLVEEACELAIATRGKRKARVAEEAADVLYHYLLLVFAAGITFDDVEAVLEKRRR
jgi:phosphoribosyl-ATP pyrophosphohydrolase/phosphoribosyl-AMP cyclohydrolase